MIREIPLRIAGYTDPPGSGTASVRAFERAGRWRRAGGSLVGWWGLAVAGAFIPVAHFLLVPGFGLFGLLVAYRRLRTAEVILSLRGGCPDCGTEQVFDVGERWAPPFELTCGHCGRGLRAKVDHGAS